MKQLITSLLLLFSLTLSAQTVDVVGPKKKQQSTAFDANKRKAEADAAAKKRAAEEAAKKRAADEAAAKKKAMQAQREEQARQEQLRREQAQREEQARQEQLRREQAQREEQARQVQLLREQAQREEQARQERLRYGNGHDWVDLGLPSGIKWATCNIGADAPEKVGDYFAWGETATKSTYDWSTYFDSANNKGTKFNKYDTKKKTILELSDDAAHVNWGGNWRMPTNHEIDELYDYCRREVIETKEFYPNGTYSDIYLLKFTSGVNGNSICFPWGGHGFRYDGDMRYRPMRTWQYRTSSIPYFRVSTHELKTDAIRCAGCPIRPVCP